MKFVISGASGLIGSALSRRLTGAGHNVLPLVRRAPRLGETVVAWDPDAGTIDRAALERSQPDVVVHLAGENVFGRWSAEKKGRIRDSRVRGTRVVSEALAGIPHRPQLLLAASAIGFYGDRGDEELTEQSGPGADFLAQVARDWEAATAPAAGAGIRVVNLRFGVVLSPEGGALGTMLKPFRLGLGGPVGSGKQFLSWITLDDALSAMLHILDDPDVNGPVNITSPQPVPNREFAKALGRVLGRPAVVPVPAFALKLAFGSEGADMLKSGQRVLPARLLAAGFHFRDVDIEPALRRILLAASPRGS